MKIPNLITARVVDENGMLTDSWRHLFEQLFGVLQQNLSDESIVTPSQPTANITQLNVPEYSGGLVYNSDTNKLMVNENGTFKTVQTT
jgi:hypothetical protein